MFRFYTYKDGLLKTLDYGLEFRQKPEFSVKFKSKVQYFEAEIDFMGRRLD